MRVVLLEFIDEAQKAIAQYGAAFFQSPDIKIISLHPKVKAFLKQQGIEAFDTIPFFNNEAQHRIILKGEELTFKILEELSLKDELGISRGYHEACLHHLRLYFNYFLSIVEILQNFCQKYPTEAIFACVPENEAQMYVAKGYIQYQERFVGLIAAEFAAQRNIGFHPLTLKPENNSLKSSIPEFLVRQFGKLLMGIEYCFLGSQDKKTIVVPATSYRMDLLLKEIKKLYPDVKILMVWEGKGEGKDALKQEMYKVYLTLRNWKDKIQGKQLLDWIIHLDLFKDYISPNKEVQKEFNRQLDGVIQKITGDWQDQFVYGGVKISRFISNKIDKGLRSDLLGLEHLTLCLTKVFKKINPKLLMSMYSVGIYYMMGELAEKCNYTALNISHGTHVPPNNEFEKIENIRLAASVIANTYPVVCVQTPWTDRFLDYYEDKRKRIVTGPLLFSVTNANDRRRIRKEILGDQNDKKIIIHAATQKGRHGMRFHITESLDEYIKTLKDIIEAVNQLEDVYFILRPHPSCDLTEEEFKTLLPDCPKMRILTKGSFAPILSASDLLISYSSTCIEEAIQNNIPVILYDQWQRYNHFNLPEQRQVAPWPRQAAYYVAQPALLKTGIQNTLQEFRVRPLADKDLQTYKYPAPAWENFTSFVKNVL